jgi:hypothetical protein
MSNVDDNMWIQYVAFGLSLAMGSQWMSCTYEGLKGNLLQAAAPLGHNYANAVGPIMLNFAIITIIPTWVNIKVFLINIE